MAKHVAGSIRASLAAELSARLFSRWSAWGGNRGRCPVVIPENELENPLIGHNMLWVPWGDGPNIL